MNSDIKLNLINPPKISYGVNFTGGHWIKFSLYAKEGIFSFSFSLNDSDPPFPACVVSDEILHFLDIFTSFSGKRSIDPEYLRNLACNCLDNNFLDCDCDLGCKKIHPDWYEQYIKDKNE